MRRSTALLSSTISVCALIGTAIDGGAQSGLGRGSQPPPGQRLQANDGDVVVIEGDARVRIVRRRAANVRAIYDREQEWFLLLIDYVPPKGGKPNGTVDMTYTFRSVEGNWPFDARWEGPAIIEDYINAGQMYGPSAGGVGVVFPFGLVQFFGIPESASDLYMLSSAVAVLRHKGSGRTGSGAESFDVAEARAIDGLSRVVQINANAPRRTDSGGFTSESVVITGPSLASRPKQPAQAPGEQAPVRVGGAVRQPERIHYVEPVYPELARQAGLTGVVILEIIVGIDGSVTNARVLRAPHQMFEQPALEAVAQWRFEPITLGGKPVPVIMTATVNFRQ